MSFSQLMSQTMGSRSQRLAAWRGMQEALEDGYHEEHPSELCEAFFATLQHHTDAALLTAVERSLLTALGSEAFLKQFASHYCKTLLASKAGALPSHPRQVPVLARWASLLSQALSQHPALVAAAAPKVLAACGAAVATIAAPQQPRRVLDVALYRLEQSLRCCEAARNAAVELAQATPPTAAAGVVAAALMHAGADADGRQKAVQAYIGSIVGSKERLPDATVYAWMIAAERLTGAEVSAAVDKATAMAKRSAETALANARGLFAARGSDLSRVAVEGTAMLVGLLRHSKEAVVEAAAANMQDLSHSIRQASALESAASALIGVLDGSGDGPKPKSAKERAVFARVALQMCPSPLDRNRLLGLGGQLRLVTLRVAAQLAGAVDKEATSEGKAALLTAAEAWALSGSMHALHSDDKEDRDAHAESEAAKVVVDMVAPLATGKDAELRRAALSVAAALALDSGLASTLAPMAEVASSVATDGAAKVAMRSEGLAGLAIAAAVASAAGDGDKGWEMFSGCQSAPAAQLLAPQTLAAAGAAGVYAAAAVAHVAKSAPAPAVDVSALATALAALAVGNSPLQRSVALPVLRTAATATHMLAAAVLAALTRLLDAFPDIPTTQSPKPSPSEAPAHTGARVIAPRVRNAVAAVAPLAAFNAGLVTALLNVLHHPVALGHNSGAAASAPARRLLKKCGVASGDLLVPAVKEIGNALMLSNAACSHSDNDHAAAHGAIATALALDHEAVWPVCVHILQQSTDPEELEALTATDERIFQTPRGRLMVEEFASKLSPDELFAAGSRPAAKKAAPDGGEKGARGKGGKKGGALSKEEQQRQDSLAAEEDVRQHVARVRRQRQLGCGLLIACCATAPETVRAATATLLPMITPIVRKQLVAEAARDDPAVPEAGAFDALVALAATLPLRGAAHRIAAALQVSAADRGSDAMQLAVHPAVVAAVRTLAAHVDAHGPLDLPAYTLVCPILEAVLLLPAGSPLHPHALAVVSAHVEADGVVDGHCGDLLPRHLCLATHLTTAAARYMHEAQAMLAALMPRVCDAEAAALVAASFVTATAEARLCALEAAVSSGVYGGATAQNGHLSALLLEPQPLSCLWVAKHDGDAKNVETAGPLWESAGDPATATAAFVDATAAHLSSEAASVREAAARAAVAAARPEPELVARLCEVATSPPSKPAPPARRAGAALAVREAAAAISDGGLVLRLMRFVLAEGLPDGVAAVRALYVEAGSALVDAHGASQLQALMPLIEDYLDNKHGLPEDVYDQVRTGAAVFLSGMAAHLPPDDPKVASIVAILKDILRTPSSVVQETASTALTPIAPKLVADEAQMAALVQYFLQEATAGERYAARRGAAFGLAGLVKGLGISALRKHGIVDAIKDSMDAKATGTAKEGGLMIVECLCTKLGRMFEPYLITVLPLLLAAFGDSKPEVREAADAAASAVMANISGPGVKLVLPTLLKGLAERAWRSKQASAQLLGAMSNCAPQQLAASLPTVVPALAGVLGDAHPKVNAAARAAIEQIGAAVRNPEVRELSGVLIKAIADPVKGTRPALEALRDTVFVHVVDVSSLALILPVVTRGMKERVGEAKRHAARILGNLAGLVQNPRDLAPYMPKLRPELETLLVDPLPEVRATAARTLGVLVRGLGAEHIEGTLPWLMATLASEASSVERSGAALGLAEVVAVLGDEHLAALMPGVVAGCRDRAPAVRDGNLTLLVHLPVTCKRAFEPHLETALPCVLEGLADEAEEVRTTAMTAATKVVELYAATRTPLLLPVLEVGLQRENWRIRESSVKLLGELLYKIAGTSGRVKLDGGDDEEGAATEAYSAALLDTLGEATRNDVLARLYLVRNDSSYAVRSAAVHVWKSVVVNTPRTLKAILPTLLSLAIDAIASRGEERQVMASRCLGELVRKMGNQVLGVVVPTLVDTMGSDSADVRLGVCLALREILDAMTSEQLPAIMPAVQAALTDPDPAVRDAAGDAFAVLFRGGAGSMVEGMLPGLLEGLAVPAKAAQSVKGLQVILGVRPILLDRVLPKLLALPLQEHRVRAVGPLLGQADSHHLTQHLSFALPRLLALPPTQRGDESLRAECHAAATAAAAAAVDSAAISELVRILLRHLDGKSSRRASACVLRDWVAATAADIDIHKPILVSSLVELFGEEDPDDAEVLPAVWAAAKAVLSTIDKQELPSYVAAVRKALSTAYDTARHNAAAGEAIEVPGLCLPRALEPIVEVFLQGLLHAPSTDIREAAAGGLGDAVAATSATALKPFTVKITGPLIRIVGDRFPPPVRVAILHSLGLIIGKAGTMLKPFVPQLQTTFLKCLPDPAEEIRLQAASNMGGLAALMTARVDALATDLANQATAAAADLKRAYLRALRGVLANASERLTAASLPGVGGALRGLVPKVGTDDEELQVALAACIGEYCGAAPDDDATEMLQETALQTPLPPTPPLATVHAVVLPVLCRGHADRLPALGLLEAGMDAAERMVRHKEFATKVAAVRTFGRLVAWASQCGRRDDVLPRLASVPQTALAPDQDRALHAETVYQLKLLAAMEHDDADALARDLLQHLLPSLCSVVTVASGTAQVTTERCLAHLLRVHENGIAAAREVATGPGMGPSEKNMLTEPYLKKLASMPLTSAFDATIDEDY